MPASVTRRSWKRCAARHRVPVPSITPLCTNLESRRDTGLPGVLQIELLDRKVNQSPQARQVVVTSGHNVPGIEPVTVKEILRVLKAAG
jgi:hypothetical protein